MFPALPSKFDFPAAEKAVRAFWEREGIFERSLEQRRVGNTGRFVFYEGPPTANGLPHPGHALTRAIKDLFPRYQTMCGKLVDRKAGWDTHGLPVEVEVCKELGIHTKEEIEAYGVERFNLKCIQSVFRYTQQWEEMTKRLGFWVNLDEAYVTYHQNYVESVWWGLKTLFDRGLLYQGHKVVWWWAQGGTALSAGEVGEGYRTIDDPSVYVKFPVKSNSELRIANRELKGSTGVPPVSSVHGAQYSGRAPHESIAGAEGRTSLLVWTTTPWTLLSNHFAAVHPELDYALVEDPGDGTHGAEYLYVAAALVEGLAKKVRRELKTVGTCKGADLVGLRYAPPVPEVYHTRHLQKPGSSGALFSEQVEQLRGGGTEYIGWRVIAADFVTLDSGTGLVHEAPAFGEVDFQALQKERERFSAFDAIPLLCAVEPNGNFGNHSPEKYRGRWVKDCDRDIIRELKERKTPAGAPLLLHQEQISHEYPFCPRAENDALIQYARKSWFVRTSQFKDEFLANNAKVNWLPEHIRDGRFGDFLRNNVDWALSRERYWGTPLPIWRCDVTGKMEAIGSFAELQAKPGAADGGYWEQKVAEHRGEEFPEHLRVHKPYIDEWTYDSPHAPGARMRRVPEVIDCWWDAGSMPFAQWGYPHVEGSVEKFSERFPADFISEAIDQTRGWFYGLLSISTLLFAEKGSAGILPARSEQPTLSKFGGAPPRRGVLDAPVTADLSIRTRHRLPHWEAGGSTYLLTTRVHSGQFADSERDLIMSACRYFDPQRYLLHAVVVMPDHVHLLLTPQMKGNDEWWSIADIMHSVKSYTSREIQRLRGTTGTLWQAEYYDRIVRNGEDFREKWEYVVGNPGRKGLSEDYPWVWIEPDQHTDVETLLPTESCGQNARTPLAAGAYPMPFRTCIVLGHMMGEDGLKMSKRKKNYKEPSYIFDAYGADAMRWYFYAAQAPWTTSRFQEANIRDAQRDFLVRLYNVFSFFNIYANIDGFAAGQADAKPRGWRAPMKRGELDRWILSEMHRTIGFVRQKMDAFENYPAAQRLNDFVDALSNWYVRRSRDRFWSAIQNSPVDQDKWDAYNTLYDVLLVVSKLIAPFTPFFADVMFANLTGRDLLATGDATAEGRPLPHGRGSDQNGSDQRGSVPHGSDQGHASVHLCDYPSADATQIDEALADEMDLVREIVSAGRAARTEAKLKVRQPLARVEIILARHEHEQWLQSHAPLIAEELNVKAVEFATSADQYVTYQIKPNFKALGPKFGKLAPQIGGALQKIDAAAARRQLTDSGRFPLEVGGQKVELTSEEVEIRLDAKPGWAAAQSRAGVIVLSTEITDALREEGMVRELIHHVQALRKDMDLPYEQRIRLTVSGAAELRGVAMKFAAMIGAECLVEKLETTEASLAEGHAIEVEGQGGAIVVARV